MQFSTWSFAKLAVVLGIGGLLLGAAGSFLIAPIYVSRAVLEMTTQSGQSATAELNSVIRQVEPDILSRSSLAGIINNYVVRDDSVPVAELYERERKTEPLEDVIERMKSDIRFDPVVLPGKQDSSAALEISFRYRDPAKARLVTATLAHKFIDSSFEQRLRQASGEHFAMVIDTASLPVRPFFPNQRFIELAGCLLGASIPFAWRRLRRKKFATWGVAISVVVFGFAGLIAADVFYVLDNWENGPNLLREQYRSTATMFVQNGSAEQLRAIASDAVNRTSLSTLINDPRLNLYKEQRRTQPLEDVIQNMRQHLAIAPYGQYFTISFEYSDRYKAQQALQGLMNRLDDTYKQTYGGLPDAPFQPAPDVIRVIDAASTPTLPVSPNRYLIALKGGLAGLVAAGLIATIRRRWKPDAELPFDAVSG
jgi:capsular polysaccharide biosynthesis protein